MILGEIYKSKSGMANKSIIILGSSRSDGNTKQAILSLDPNGEMLVVDLNDLQITPYNYDHENQHDDYIGLMENILNYDVIILATPVYWYSMSSQMKIFIDRLSDCLTIRKDIGRALVQKTIYVLASYGTSLPKGFEDAFRQTCQYMNMQYAGCFFHYSGTDRQALANNDKIMSFGKEIDLRLEEYKKKHNRDKT